MFMHGGLFHLGGNMLYLWIFGNNIEDRLGHVRFIIFYLFCGICAAYSHALTNPDSAIPMIGASGAVSGILGAYILLFPRANVHTLLFLGFFITTVKIPALIVIGFWAIIQFLSGMVSSGLQNAGGVAWFAHLGIPYRATHHKSLVAKEDKTMIVVCPKCQTKLHVDEGKFAVSLSGFQCPRCTVILFMKKPLPFHAAKQVKRFA